MGMGSKSASGFVAPAVVTAYVRHGAAERIERV